MFKSVQSYPIVQNPLVYRGKMVAALKNKNKLSGGDIYSAGIGIAFATIVGGVLYSVITKKPPKINNKIALRCDNAAQNILDASHIFSAII